MFTARGLRVNRRTNLAAHPNATETFSIRSREECTDEELSERKCAVSLCADLVVNAPDTRQYPPRRLKLKDSLSNSIATVSRLVDKILDTGGQPNALVMAFVFITRENEVIY